MTDRDDGRVTWVTAGIDKDDIETIARGMRPNSVIEVYPVDVEVVDDMMDDGFPPFRIVKGRVVPVDSKGTLGTYDVAGGGTTS